MKKQFQNYFHDWSNLLSFALALIPAWLMYKYPPRVKVPFYAIVLIILIALLSVWLNIKQWLDIRQLLEDQQRLIAKKRQASVELINCVNDHVLCWPNDLIGHDSVVSFYENIDGFENLIAYGYVESINDNKVAQIVLFDSYKDVISIISTHKNIIVKPTITRDKLSEILNMI